MRFVTSLDIRGWALLGVAALCIALPGALTTLGTPAQAGVTLEERKLPMKFNWVACEPNCRGWVSAVGIVTADSPRDVRRIRARTRSQGRHHRAGFQRRLGQRFHHARSAVPRPRRAHHRRRQHSQSDCAGPAPECRAGSLLRVDVRVPAAGGQDALCARRRACPRSPDLDGRPRRRRAGGQLHRAGPDDRRARHRPSCQVHLRHGRHRRSCCRWP